MHVRQPEIGVQERSAASQAAHGKGEVDRHRGLAHAALAARDRDDLPAASRPAGAAHGGAYAVRRTAFARHALVERPQQCHAPGSVLAGADVYPGCFEHVAKLRLEEADTSLLDPCEPGDIMNAAQRFHCPPPLADHRPTTLYIQHIVGFGVECQYIVAENNRRKAEA